MIDASSQNFCPAYLGPPVDLRECPVCQYPLDARTHR